MTYTPPKHLSYSQWNTYTDCARAWYLGKIVGAEEAQTWYIPIGSAVHGMVEYKLATGDDPVAEDFFYPLVSAQMLIEPDTTKWLAGGKKGDPVSEDKALQKVKDCYERALEFLDDIDVWEVEYDASGRLPGLEVEIKAFVDIIGEHKKHGPAILDWKSGASKPKNNFQVETYRARLMLDKKYRWAKIKTGLWAMLDPKASVARPIDLSAVDPAAVGARYQKAYDGMKAKAYKANKKFGCKFCFHQDNCLVQAGPTARSLHYDRSSIDGIPF